MQVTAVASSCELSAPRNSLTGPAGEMSLHWEWSTHAQTYRKAAVQWNTHKTPSGTRSSLWRKCNTCKTSRLLLPIRQKQRTHLNANTTEHVFPSNNRNILFNLIKTNKWEWIYLFRKVADIPMEVHNVRCDKPVTVCVQPVGCVSCVPTAMFLWVWCTWAYLSSHSSFIHIPT